MGRREAIVALLALAIVLGPARSLAECAADVGGKVHCSKVPSGGAEEDGTGGVVCGKGQCRRDSNGVVMCSSVEGGGAAADLAGHIWCLGGCEEASHEMCVRGE